MIWDYHVHTPLCGHANGAPREYVLEAMKKGLSEIGFSDHNPMPTQFDPWRMAPDQFDSYLKIIDEVRQEFPDFPIRLGMECDFIPGYENHLRSLISRSDFDYIIGSVHYILPPWDKNFPVKIDDWKDYPPEESWKHYFNSLAESAQSGLFDFLAHPDLIKNTMKKPQDSLVSYFKEALDAIKDCDVAVEINTSGLRKKVSEQYPCKEFIEEACKRNIPLLINSDAHNPHEVALFFKEARQLAWDAGYRKLCRFEKRRRIETSFELLT